MNQWSNFQVSFWRPTVIIILEEMAQKSYFFRKCPKKHISSEISGDAHPLRLTFGRPCSPVHLHQLHIYDLELLAHVLVAQVWGPQFVSQHVQIFTDNIACFCLVWEGRSAFDNRLRMAKELNPPVSRPRIIGSLMLTPGRLIRNVSKSSRISWMSMEWEPRSATFHLKYSHFSLILEFLQGLTPHSWATIQSRPSHPNGRLLGSFGMELVKIHY